MDDTEKLSRKEISLSTSKKLKLILMYDQNKLIHKFYLRNGEKDGLSFTYFRSEPKKIRDIYRYKKGKLIGKQRSFYKNGTMQHLCYYNSREKKIGKETIFFPDGTIKCFVHNDGMGNLHGQYVEYQQVNDENNKKVNQLFKKSHIEHGNLHGIFNIYNQEKEFNRIFGLFIKNELKKVWAFNDEKGISFILTSFQKNKKTYTCFQQGEMIENGTVINDDILHGMIWRKNLPLFYQHGVLILKCDEKEKKHLCHVCFQETSFCTIECNHGLCPSCCEHWVQETLELKRNFSCPMCRREYNGCEKLNVYRDKI